ncbi:GIY-YIG nuclease family protein [Pelagibius sp.]|uniref:GIY-YIG nuclease family protein n=1 Tax=Pelagibius sp. TaxID=1931238 RepID=UPI003B50E9D8
MVRPTPAVDYYVYILASQPHGTLYIGVTNDLVRRVYEHREGLADGFTKRHRVKRLVYFEQCADVERALQREKTLKHWKRDWKIALIEDENPHWTDLWDGLSG